ncbi:MAG: prephenate dehydratase [Proteobacteria bacterium]|nr:prephenate dehydratase [Pseudomonadota bacterium]HQR02991.1 prephenate dehydratase [Rhodocyclaceae bacterium]
MSDHKPEAEELGRLRQGIDHIDAEVLRLISERAALAHRIGEIKQGVVYRPEREAQVLRRIAELNSGPLSDFAAQALFREIMSVCLALEQPLRIAYLGPAGTYSEIAAKKHFGMAPTFIPCAAIDEVFRTVEAGGADYGVIPVENSTEGAVPRSLDLLLASPLRVCGEVMLPIHHQLLSRETDAATVTRVYSHSQSLAQCQHWLNTNLPGVPRVSVASNAEAARLASVEQGSAAIAGAEAGILYGLQTLAANIEDDPANTTRFLVVAHHDAGPSGKDRTSLVCSAPNRPGAVHELLGAFARHGVSMSKFESRPARGMGGGAWEYVFYIDLEGHRLDAPVAAALDELRLEGGFVKELGSYPRAVY